MSDHFDGPRMIAEPVIDITDLYAFPSPEKPGHLVFVLPINLYRMHRLTTMLCLFAR